MALAFDKVRFLVVDDNDASVQIVRTVLKALGVKEVAATATLTRALQKLETEKTDIVILDLLLGEQDGLEFLRSIRREDHRHAFLPVLVLSAYTDKERVEAARDAGATEVCAKPISPAELYRKLVTMIAEPRAFVRSPGYFGPDRRRRNDDNWAEQERRALPPESNEEVGG